MAVELRPFGNEFRAQVLCTHFLHGLRGDIKEHILINLPAATYQEALTVAKNFDTDRNIAHGIQENNPDRMGGKAAQVFAGFALKTTEKDGLEDKIDRLQHKLSQLTAGPHVNALRKGGPFHRGGRVTSPLPHGHL